MAKKKSDVFLIIGFSVTIVSFITVIIGIINTQDTFSLVTTLKLFTIMGIPFLLEEYLFFKNFYGVLKNDCNGFLRIFKIVLSALLIISVVFQALISSEVLNIGLYDNAFNIISALFFVSEWPLAVVSLIISLIIGKKPKLTE